MSAVRLTPHHPDTPQARAHQALRSLIYRIGVTEAADLLGCDPDTVRRRLDTGNINAFGWADVMLLKKRERDEFGTSDLHDAETRAIYRRAPISDRQLAAELSEDIAGAAKRIQHANAILSDGMITKEDLSALRELRQHLMSDREHLQELDHGLARKIAALQGGR